MATLVRTLPTLGQLVGLLAVLVGLYLLLGLAWVFVIGGSAVFVTALLAEFSGPRLGWKDGS